MNNMKRMGFIMVLVATIFISCSSTNGGSNDTSAVDIVEKTGGDDTPEGHATVKPEHLDKEAFLKKIMNYEKHPKEWVFEGDKPCIVDFYADWCKPCKMIAPILEELAVEYEGQINIYKVDTQKEKELAAVFGIQSIPTILFIPKNGNPSLQKGALPKEIFEQIINDFLLKENNTNK